MGIATAVTVAAVIGAGSAYYQGEQQKKIAKENQAKQEAAAAAEKARADKIAADTRPEGEKLQDTQFGTTTGDTQIGSVNQFLVPKTSSLSSSGRSGLGFKV